MSTIVLLHGLFGFGQLSLGPVQLSYFQGIDREIAMRGHRVITPSVHPTASIASRAQQLKDILLNSDLTEKVILVAHSMGGLDARYLITHLDMARHVKALVTISTPHHGSPFANWAMTHLGDRLRLLKFMSALKLESGAFADLTTDQCAKFNALTPDAPGVKYFSISAKRPMTRVPVWAMHAWHIVNVAEGENDGLVSVKSATWGEHLETWPADHWHTINHRFVLELQNKTGDITPYYLRMLETVTAKITSQPEARHLS